MKPVLKLKSFRILAEVASYVLEYDIRGVSLVQAPSDICDGSYDRKELDELIRKRIFRITQHDEQDPEYDKDTFSPSLCSYGWTVDFTPAAIKHFFPERENERPRPTHKRSVPRHRVRSRRTKVRGVR